MNDDEPLHRRPRGEEVEVLDRQLAYESGGFDRTREVPREFSEPPHGLRRIVLAEDNPYLRCMIREILQRLGYLVETYASGVDALEALSKDDRPVELLLTDFDMPGLTGYELARRLRMRWPRARVLLTSGTPEEDLSPQVKPADWPPFISKPFTSAALGSKLREVLGERSK
jgi:CheY-like chemotaxis protein